MSSQNNWNNPDMYYQQPQSGAAPGDGYGGSNAGYGHSSYNTDPANSANAQYAGAYANGPGTQFAGPGSTYVYQPLPPTNTMAIIALVASIFGVMSSFFLVGIAGIVMGHIARKQIRRSGERGDGMAVASLWVGYIGTGFWVLFWVAYVGIAVLLFGVAMVGSGSVS